MQNDESYYAVEIYWDELHTTIGSDLVSLIFEDILEEMNNTSFIFRNLTWDTTNENEISPSNFKDLISFYSSNDQEEFAQIIIQILSKHKMNHKVIKKVFDGIDLLESIHCNSIKRCPVCGYWESVENFKFSTELNLSLCNQSMYCR